MSGKKFLIILGGLAVVSFAVSMAASIFFGGSPAPKSPAQGTGQSPKPKSLVDVLAATKAPAAPSARQEQLTELIKDLELRINEYKRKADSLDSRERRIAMAEKDLQRRAEELEKLRMQLIAPLTRLKDAMAEWQRSRVLVGKQEKRALMSIAEKYQTMDPVKGSGILATMAADGQTDDVVKILYYMSERTSAKFLAEMTDQALAAKLTGLMKKISEQG